MLRNRMYVTTSMNTMAQAINMCARHVDKALSDASANRAPLIMNSATIARAIRSIVFNNSLAKLWLEKRRFMTREK